MVAYINKDLCKNPYTYNMYLCYLNYLNNNNGESFSFIILLQIEVDDIVRLGTYNP